MSNGVSECVFMCVCFSGVYVSLAGWGQNAALIIMSVWTIAVRMELSVWTIWTATAVCVHRDSGTGSTLINGNTDRKVEEHRGQHAH